MIVTAAATKTKPARKIAAVIKPKRLKTKTPKALTKAKVVELHTVPRPYIGIIYDRKKRQVGRSHHYAHLTNAVGRLTRMALRLEPGTVAEVSHAVTGKQIGTIIVGVNGNFRTTGNWVLFLQD